MKRFLAIGLAASMGLVFAGSASALVVPGVPNGSIGDYPAGAAANRPGRDDAPASPPPRGPGCFRRTATV